MFFRDGTPLPPASHITREVGSSFAHIPLGPVRGGLADTLALQKTLPPGSVLRTKDGQYEAMIMLPKGVHTLVAPEDRPPYTSKQPREFSLADCPEQEEFMFFSAKRQLTLDFKKNSVARTEVIPLYHGHVLWSYKLRMKRCEDGKFELFLDSCGPHLDNNKWNQHPGMAMPLPLGLHIIPPLVRMSDADPMVHFVLSTGDHHVCSHRYTEQELRNFAVDNKLTLDLGLLVPRAYFSLERIADHSAFFEHVKTDRSRVDVILRGEKLPDADWQITGGFDGSGDDNQTGVYHVHKRIFFELFKKCMVQLTHSGGRTKLHSFSDDALKMAILVAYRVEVPLPQPGQPIMYLIVKMCSLFDEYFKQTVFAQWERAICSRALALETRDPSPSSIGDLLHLLDGIYEAPPGAMPAAENVAIGVLADMVHLNARASVEQYLMETVRPVVPAVGCKNAHKILHDVEKFLGAVGSVFKGSVPASWPAEEDEENEEEEVNEEEEKNEEEEVNDEVNEEAWRDANNGPWLDCTIL